MLMALSVQQHNPKHRKSDHLPLPRLIERKRGPEWPGRMEEAHCCPVVREAAEKQREEEERVRVRKFSLLQKEGTNQLKWLQLKHEFFDRYYEGVVNSHNMPKPLPPWTCFRFFGPDDCLQPAMEYEHYEVVQYRSHVHKSYTQAWVDKSTQANLDPRPNPDPHPNRNLGAPHINLEESEEEVEENVGWWEGGGLGIFSTLGAVSAPSRLGFLSPCWVVYQNPWREKFTARGDKTLGPPLCNKIVAHDTSWSGCCGRSSALPASRTLYCFEASGPQCRVAPQ